MDCAVLRYGCRHVLALPLMSLKIIRGQRRGRYDLVDAGTTIKLNLLDLLRNLLHNKSMEWSLALYSLYSVAGLQPIRGYNCSPASRIKTIQSTWMHIDWLKKRNMENAVTRSTGANVLKSSNKVYFIPRIIGATYSQGHLHVFRYDLNNKLIDNIKTSLSFWYKSKKPKQWKRMVYSAVRLSIGRSVPRSAVLLIDINTI